MKASLRSALVAVVLATSGCSLIDPTDPPAITFEERLCNSNADCIGLEDTITDLDGITSLPCVVISTGCNTSRNRCEVRVEQVSDADGDGRDALACGGDDCDDTRPTVYPGAPEACDGVVTDCSADGGGDARPSEDADGDRYSPPDADCVTGQGAFPKTDCDDGNPNTFPDAPEACDGEINSCETLGPRVVEDMDGDGHSAPSADCITAVGNANVFAKDDCDDADPDTYPGAPEVCDRKFNDCSSTLPRVVEDADGDGLASFLAPCEGGTIPKNECVGADLDATTRYCAPTEMSPLIVGFANPTAVAVVDLDGASGVEVVAANSVSMANGQLRRCVETGGAFSCSTLNASFPQSPTQFRVGDADGAGGDDVFFASRNAGGGYGVYFFTSSGAATPVTTVGAGTGSAVYDVTDFGVGGALPGDGDTDVAVLLRSGVNATLRLATNDGGGVFSIVDVDATVANGLAVAVADFDGDGVVDFAVTTTTSVLVYRSAGNPPGTWTEAVVSSTVALPSAIEADDLDDDGDPDFVVGNGTSGDIVVFLNDGGVFTSVSLFPAGAGTQQRFPGVSSLVLRDYDLDGDVDIGATSATLDAISWWEAAGSAIWLRHDVVTDFDGANAMAPGDIDGDGDPDIVATAALSNAVVWWRTHYVSNITFTEQRVDRAFTGARGVALADLDADGDLDFAASSNGGDNVTVWVNVDARGTVLSEIPLDLAFPDVREVAVSDLDGDGDHDVLAISGVEVRWWENEEGDGRLWSAHRVLATGLTGVSHLVAFDADEDDDADVAIASGGVGGAVTLFVNDGAGAFTASSVGAVERPRGLAALDVDGDGDQDLVVASELDGQVYLFTNGGGAFVRSPVGTGGLAQAYDVTLGDVNRDARPDVVAISLDGIVRVFLNGASGYTTAPIVVGAFAGNYEAAAIELADLDSDGDLDVVASGVGANALGWFESTALDGRTWIPHRVTVFGTSEGPAGIDVGDIDLDGNVDVAAALSFGGDVTWWKSDGAAWWNP